MNQLRNKSREFFFFLWFSVNPVFIFSGLLLLTLLWASFLPSLKFNYDIESFFSETDPEVAFYYNHREIFENENDFVLAGIKNQKGIFQESFLKKLDTLTEELKKLPHVVKVFSPTGLYEIVKGPIGSIQIPLIHVHEPEKYVHDKNRIYESDLYKNAFFSGDTSSVSILIKKEGLLNRKANDSLLLSLKEKLSSYHFDEFHLAGRIHTQYYYVGTMKKQMSLFALLACLLFIASLFFIFRSIRYVLISLGAVLISLTWIFGIIGSLGIHLDLMLTLLPCLIFVISTSGSIHLITRFREEYFPGKSKSDAIRGAVIRTSIPNFLNALTTAAGFASLAMLPVLPIQRFGIITAFGILISFVISLLFIPASLRALRLTPSIRKVGVQSGIRHERIVENILKKPLLTGSLFLVFTLAALYFSFQVKINNHFLDDLSETSSLKSDLDFFERNFSGIRPFEINIQSATGGSLMNYQALMEMDSVETYLKTEYGVGFMFSPLVLIKSLNKTLHGGIKEYYRIPDSQQELDGLLKLAEKQKIWRRFLPVLSENKSMARITGRTTDEGSLSLLEKNKKLEMFLKAHSCHLKYTLTGAAYLMDRANASIAWSLTKGILLAIATTTLVIWLFTASWKLALISLIPNLIPLIISGGIMGFAEVPLKVATSIIFTVIYGIAVDDTIHFLNTYRINLEKNNNANDVIKHTLLSMWSPMLYTSIVLFAGFMIFSLSEFSSISILGVLISISLFVALISDLLLLPVLLLYKEKLTKFRKQDGNV